MATINYNSGNINVSFFPTNVNPIWFCDKNTGGINIATNGLSIAANTLQLGNSGTATQVNGTFRANLINSTAASQRIDIGNNQDSGILTIGDNGLRTGPTYISNNTAGDILIGYSQRGGNTYLGNISTAGTFVRGTNINIGDNTTSGDINIGHTSTFKGNIGIGTNISGGSIGIGAWATGNTELVLGNVNKTTTYLRGSTIYVQSTELNLGGSTTYLRGTSNLYIGDNTTTGNIDIGSAQTTGQINIGGSSRTGFINIGRFTRSNTYIASEAGGSSLLVMGTKDQTTSYLRGSTVNICDDGGVVKIGNTTGNIQIGYPSTFTGNIGIGTLMGGGSIDIGSYPTGNNQIVIGDGTKSTTYLRGSTIYIADAGTTVNIGNTNANINMTASKIQQNIKTQDGTVIQNVIGNADSVSSLSTTFNYKNTAVQTAIHCYTIQVGTSVGFTNQLFELVVSGNNTYHGPYSYKFMFVILRYTPNIYVQGQTRIFPASGNDVVLSFSYPDAYTANLYIQTVVGTPAYNQSFITTLISYPTCNAGGPLNDFSITAV